MVAWTAEDDGDRNNNTNEDGERELPPMPLNFTPADGLPFKDDRIGIVGVHFIGFIQDLDGRAVPGVVAVIVRGNYLDNQLRFLDNMSRRELVFSVAACDRFDIVVVAAGTVRVMDGICAGSYTGTFSFT